MSAPTAARSRSNRLWATLRSRRLAIWLLVGVSGYLGLTTFVQLPQPFSNPLFLSAVGILSASTAACAWERTRHAFTGRASVRLVDSARDLRALQTPTFSVVLSKRPAAADVRAMVRLAMERSGLRTFEHDGIVAGTANSFGRWGSPLFHWALTGLFVFAALGQLTRAEGLMDVVVGGSLPDAMSSYAVGSPVAPLFLGRYTGVQIGVVRIDREHEMGGGAKDAAPLVTVTSNGAERVRQWVYPNAPARFGPLTIHRNDTGPALIVSLSFPGGQEATSVAAFFPPISEAGAGGRATLDVANRGTGAGYVIEFERLTGARVMVRVAKEGFESPPLAVGDAAKLPDGTTIRVENLTSYARLAVVNDWSLNYVFVSFCLVVLGAALSVFLPPRRAVAAIGGEGDRIDVRVAQRKSDPAFSLRLERALHQAVLVTTESKDTE